MKIPSFITLHSNRLGVEVEAAIWATFDFGVCEGFSLLHSSHRPILIVLEVNQLVDGIGTSRQITAIVDNTKHTF